MGLGYIATNACPRAVHLLTSQWEKRSVIVPLPTDWEADRELRMSFYAYAKSEITAPVIQSASQSVSQSVNQSITQLVSQTFLALPRL